MCSKKYLPGLESYPEFREMGPWILNPTCIRNLIPVDMFFNKQAKATTSSLVTSTKIFVTSTFSDFHFSDFH